MIIVVNICVVSVVLKWGGRSEFCHVRLYVCASMRRNVALGHIDDIWNSLGNSIYCAGLG